MRPGEFIRDIANPENPDFLEQEIAELQSKGLIVYIKENEGEHGPPIYFAAIVDKTAYRHMTDQTKLHRIIILPDFFQAYPHARYGYSAIEALQNAKQPWNIYLDDDSAA